MKLSETLLLLRNGYTKSEINAMSEDDNTETVATLKAENERLASELRQAQSTNLSKAETEKPVAENVNLNDILKG